MAISTPVVLDFEHTFEYVRCGDGPGRGGAAGAAAGAAAGPVADEPPGWVPGEPSWQVTDLVPDPVQDRGLLRGGSSGRSGRRRCCWTGRIRGRCWPRWPRRRTWLPVRMTGGGAGLGGVPVAGVGGLGGGGGDGGAGGAGRAVARGDPAGSADRRHTVAAERIAAAELAAALGISERSAAGRVGLALDLARLPETRAGLAAGRQQLATVRMVVDTLRPLGDQAAARVEAAVLPRYGGRCYTDVSRALRRAVLAVDPEAGEKRRQRGSRTARWRPTPGRRGGGRDDDRPGRGRRGVRHLVDRWRRGRQGTRGPADPGAAPLRRAGRPGPPRPGPRHHPPRPAHPPGPRPGDARRPARHRWRHRPGRPRWRPAPGCGPGRAGARRST